MGGPRRHLLIAGVLLAFSACGPVERSVRPHATGERGVAHGREYATLLVQLPRSSAPADDASIVALGYLERLRLGLGGPFRLMHQALSEPRLDDETRRRLAQALLARTLDGHAFQVDPYAFDRVGPAGPTGVGRLHLELIEGAVREARDARSGEMAVRIAYTLAAAEGSVTSRTPIIAAQAAALLRDARLARQDARSLVAAADDAGVDATDLVARWRAQRQFAVEGSPLAPLPLAVEREAAELAPRLAEAIRAIGPRVQAGERLTAMPGPAPLLNSAVAQRLAAIADTFSLPPQTPVVVALDVHRRELLDVPSLTTPERRARERLLDRGFNEERFAAHYALVYHAERDTRRAAPALTALWAASALRTYGQETPWFPGFGGPSARELQDRFGFESVQFASGVPAEWRPYYRRMLETAVLDLYRILPSLSLRGLNIHFGDATSRPATLALHDPSARTIYLPPATGAGTIAHEIAHDIDWQIALRRYRVRGDYGTDRSTRMSGDRIASSIRALAAARMDAPGVVEAGSHQHATRPAEIFARSVDWFVVVSLAREGRTNGYLSSVQDDILTGYGTVTQPDVTGAAGAALVSILDEVTPVYASTRSWFLRTYGPQRLTTPYDLVRRVLETAAPAESVPAVQQAATWQARFEEVEHGRDAGLQALDAWLCGAPAAVYDRDLELARRELVLRAAAARARGVAHSAAFELAGTRGTKWMRRRFYGPRWAHADVEAATAALLESIALTAEAIEQVPLRPTAPFNLHPQPQNCATGSVDWARS